MQKEKQRNTYAQGKADARKEMVIAMYQENIDLNVIANIAKSSVSTVRKWVRGYQRKPESEPFFKNVCDVGNLYREYVLYDDRLLDEYALAVYRDDPGNLYLGLYICGGKEYVKEWLIVECSFETLHMLISEEVEIADIFGEQIIMTVGLDAYNKQTSNYTIADRNFVPNLPGAKEYMQRDRKCSEAWLQRKEKLWR